MRDIIQREWSGLASRDTDRGQRLNESREFSNKMSHPVAAGFAPSHGLIIAVSSSAFAIVFEA
jgi:hypothetical protein